MLDPLNHQLKALRQCTPAQLRAQYLERFGEPSRSGNKEFLCKRIAWRIQSLAEGGLSERARRRAAELARDADLRMTIPRLPPATAQPSAPRAFHATASRVPIPGTILTRQYKGKLIQVTVLPDGFEHEGAHYRSLSAIAKQITGTQWNGYLFFGLKTGTPA